MTARQPCPACDRPTPDGLLCEPCVHRLRLDLAALPGLLAQLDTTTSRQNATGETPAKRSGEEPMPFDWDTADQHWAIRNTLQTWVRTLDLGDLWIDQQGCWCKPYQACQGRRRIPLPDDPAIWCWWLAQRLERIRGHVEAAQLADEIGYAARAARAAIDLPGEGEYCGTCDVCGKHLYAGRDAAEVVCRYCAWAGIEAVYPVQGRRQDLAARAEAQLLAKRQILEVAPFYGLPINPSTFRSWTSRGRLKPEDYRAGVPLYRLGAALDLARAAKMELTEESA